MEYESYCMTHADSLVQYESEWVIRYDSYQLDDFKSRGESNVIEGGRNQTIFLKTGWKLEEDPGRWLYEWLFRWIGHRMNGPDSPDELVMVTLPEGIYQECKS